MVRDYSIPNLQKRKNLRLTGHDYCQPGGYFITICAADMAKIFGIVQNGMMILNQIGYIVQEEWFWSSIIHENIELYQDEFVLMPNHLHGIIWIMNINTTQPDEEYKKPGPKPGSVSSIIGQFKSQTSKRINKILNTPSASIWQRGFYDHIIRNQQDLHAIRKYILDNPNKWEEGKDSMDYK